MRTLSGKRGILWLMGVIVSFSCMEYPAHANLKSTSGPVHGKTTVSLPPALFTARVDINGKITGSGSKITVWHSDPGTFCNKVKSVSIILDGKCYGSQGCSHYAKPGTKNINLCNFNANDASFDLFFPGINVPAQHNDIANAWAAECRASGKNGTQLVTRHPWFNEDVGLHMSYNNGDYYREFHDVPRVDLTCDPCPPLIVRDNLALAPDTMVTIPMPSLVTGGVPPYTVTFTQLPTGLIDSSGLLTGRPASGVYRSTITVSDSCKSSSANKVSKSFEFKVKDSTPPSLNGASAAPGTLPMTGGTVQIKVTATDNKGVSGVVASVSGSAAPANVTLSRSGGTPYNGTWQGIYNVPANTTGKDVRNAISFRATDIDGNTADLAGTAAPSLLVEGKDKIPPKIASFTVTPTVFDYTGGNITVAVKASDNIGVQAVTMHLTKPDGTRSGMRLPPAGGTAANGEWKTSWTMPGNFGSAPQTYSIYISVSDNGGNLTTGQPVSVTVPVAPPKPQMPNRPTAPRNPASPKVR